MKRMVRLEFIGHLMHSIGGRETIYFFVQDAMP